LLRKAATAAIGALRTEPLTVDSADASTTKNPAAENAATENAAIAPVRTDNTDNTDNADVAAIKEALELLLPLAATAGIDLAGFRAELSLGAEVDTWDPRANRISLLTLHAAKGLEFPVVFIVGCADGLLPLRWPGERDTDGAAEAEERRLFFVGVSRAQSHLYLSHPLGRLRGGKPVPLRPSPFLLALGDDLAARSADAAAERAPRSQQLRLL
jgi:DNA helicase-2/ATP-dependent DNA helicase PcrA